MKYKKIKTVNKKGIQFKMEKKNKHVFEEKNQMDFIEPWTSEASNIMCIKNNNKKIWKCEK